MTKAVLEAGSETAAARTIAAVPSPTLAVPASLYASLMARLDRLGGPAKELAQIAAAIGREFSHALLASVVPQPEAGLTSALDRLIAAGLLFRRGVAPHATYLFKHALVQDAAYGTLLREPRRTLHARIAETIDSEFAESAESRPELLARHWTEAGVIEKAADLWGKAGQRSLAQSALVEAVEQLTRALDQMLALCFTSLTYSLCGSYSAANARLDENRALANEKGAALWKAFGKLSQGCGFALTGKTSDAAQTITAGLAEFRATGSTFWTPLFLSYLAKAYAELRQLDDAWRSIDEVITAVQATKETLCEAEVHRVAGEIALLSPDVVKAEAYFERALVIARQQQAKSWELRAATSLTRLWRDQGKVQQARELLAPIYGWFTEGFDTRDLKEAKALLDELAA